ncbi:MAG TPA: sulfatase-like hydrolase/transferase [Casimicrobiaceae bacterium]|nr:sulfatase-like hydrolase/transferase [Casimicrobiaceae bacterium]
MPRRRPSFVFILADDLGYADLGVYGARMRCTPHLDRMAAEGLRFTDAYANSPVCSPTRFALMTGRYQYRLRGGAEEPIAGAARGRSDLGLPPSHPTLPSLLRDAGYHTALVGKWHLGYPPDFGPTLSGYAEFFGPVGGAVDYFSHRDTRGVHDLYEGDCEITKAGYLTDLVSDRSCEVIRAQPVERSFLLSVHYTAPHWPWEARDDADESARIAASLLHVDGGSVATYCSMVRQMDEGIGAILGALDATGRREDTLVVFTSDNGGERFSDTWPLVGGKMELLEGGIRVPLLARWPDAIASGMTTGQVAITMDWAATMLEVAGVAPDADYPLDGMSLLTTFADPSRIVERELFWRMKHRDQRAVRVGDWKYLAREGFEYLYDLSVDPRERANLAKRVPQRFAELRSRYARWATTMPEIPQDASVSLVYKPGDIAAS